MGTGRIRFASHAAVRMFERGIDTEDVRQVLECGDIIEAYPHDMPLPSRLVLGWARGRPIHVVVADDPSAHETLVITTYLPDQALWTDDFKRRKP